MTYLIIFTSFGCTEGAPLFNSYRKEVFDATRITKSATKTIQVLNNSPTDVQHIISIAFYAGSNKDGNFQVSEARVNTEKTGLKDILVPAMGVLNLTITYAPLNLNTSNASFGGWVTTDKEKGTVAADETVTDISVKGAISMMTAMAGGTGRSGLRAAITRDIAAQRRLLPKASSEGEGENTPVPDNIAGLEAAVHRAVLIVAYDKPQEGYVDIELVGGAVPGPKGEVTAVAQGGGGGGAACDAGGTKACFSGTFSIDLPGLMKNGAREVPMSGPIPLTIDAGTAKLNMDEFPPVLIALKGNGPGEPLEGKPVDAISIVISGTPENTSSGSFDGTNLSLTGVSFRIRILLGEIKLEDINPSLAAAVDFNIPDLSVTTSEPFDGTKIVFGVDTTLSSAPSGNGLFDSFLGNARVVVKFSGTLKLP